MDKKSLIIAIVFFALYWPVIAIGAFYGHGLSWGGGPKTFWEHALMWGLKFFFLFPSLGVFLNSLISTIIIYILLIIVKYIRTNQKSPLWRKNED
jgi:hypothetical protein